MFSGPKDLDDEDGWAAGPSEWNGFSLLFSDDSMGFPQFLHGSAFLWNGFFYAYLCGMAFLCLISYVFSSPWLDFPWVFHGFSHILSPQMTKPRWIQGPGWPAWFTRALDKGRLADCFLCSIDPWDLDIHRLTIRINYESTLWMSRMIISNW